MSVLDQLPEQRPIAILKEIDQVSREMKSPQTRGSGSIINHRIYSALAYDLLIPGDYGKRVYEIEFLPDNMQFGGALCYRLYVVVMQGTAPAFIDDANLRRVPVSNARQRWRFQCSYGVQTKLKFYFFAQASGTFTANLI